VATTATILLLDLGFDGDEPVAIVHRADRHKTDPQQPDPSIRCHFRQKTPSSGTQDFASLGVHIETAADIIVQTVGKTGLARSAGRLSFEFDTSGLEPTSRLDLIAVFPHDLVPAAMRPLPHEAKVSNDRLVVRWQFQGRQPQPLLSWEQRKLEEGDELGGIEDGITSAGKLEHKGNPIVAPGAESAAKPAPRAHVVILVHGINTTGLWQNLISQVLREEGLVPEPIGYDTFDVFSFLRPSDHARDEAVKLITKNILDLRKQHPEARFSFVAHSFGTFIVTKFLAENEDFRVSRLILCGSVLPRTYSFVDLSSRLEETNTPGKKIVSECGTHDIWPVLAERITKRYGPSGTFGSNDARVHSRWHSYMRHSGFLTETFCRKFWIPFLKNGNLVPGARNVNEIPWYIRLLSRLPLKSIVVAVPVLALLCYLTSEPPSDYRLGAGSHGFGFANSVLSDITVRLARSSRYTCPTDCLFRGRERVTLESVASENLSRVVVRGSFVCERCYPMQALRKFVATFPACLRVSGLDTGRVSLDVNPNGVEAWTDAGGRQWTLCKVRQE
jgi:pimeloyl-ACP methyl ester carboxylesterase